MKLKIRKELARERWRRVKRQQPRKIILTRKEFVERSKRILREKQNVFLLSLAALSFGSVVSLAALGEARITVYLSVLSIAYFASTLVFKVKRRPSFDFLAVVLVIVFAASIVSTII
jgi:hypothetical protein